MISPVRMPPHSVEAEQAVLGGLLLDNRALDDVCERVGVNDFYRTEHQILFRAITDLIGQNQPCDFITLIEALRHSGRLEEAGGVPLIGMLANETPSAANIHAYATLVRERSVMRGLVTAGQDVTALGFDPGGRSVGELTDAAEQLVMSIRDAASNDSATCFDVPEIMRSVLDHIHRSNATGGGLGLSTGFRKFDETTQGLAPGDLVILAARPSMGKTSLAMGIAEHVAFDLGMAVAVFSMEMSADQIGFRLLASRSRVPLQRLRSGQLSNIEMDNLVPAVSSMQRVQLFVDEEGGLSPMTLRAKARRLKRRADLKLIVVDYLQLMQIPGGHDNRTTEVSEISRSLKTLAKELGVPIIALSQLNRGLESRPDKRPRLSDLRESGGIEQDADLVMFVYRPWVYDSNADPREAKIIIAKQRNGPIDEIDIQFAPEFARFSDLSS